jgi:pimeloyl-ACP methyl ester carboxylesterase
MNLSMNGPLARRLRLATKPAPPGVRGPSLRLWLGEGLRVVPPLAWRSPPVQPAVTPRTVMLLPGFAAHPRTMRHLRRALETAGHSVTDWGEGFNLGPDPDNLARLTARVDRLRDQTGQKPILIGWSLGGLFARELAHRLPDAVGGVITMGTPFSGDRHANNAWRTYHLVTGHDVSDPPVQADFAAKPPVPTVALWSSRDGIVAPRSARGKPGERDRAIGLRCTHIGFSADPQAIALVLDLLDGGQDWA